MAKKGPRGPLVRQGVGTGDPLPTTPDTPNGAPSSAVAEPPPMADDAIWYARPGQVHFAGLDDGSEVVVRFRAKEVRNFERRRGKAITKILEESDFGVDFMADALAVGAAHMFRGPHKRGVFDEARVDRWLDRCEDNGIPFDELLRALIKAILGGMPGGARHLERAEAAERAAAADDEDGAPRPPMPSPSPLETPPLPAA